MILLGTFFYNLEIFALRDGGAGVMITILPLQHFTNTNTNSAILFLSSVHLKNSTLYHIDIQQKYLLEILSYYSFS